jgi:hypothetical protein
VSALDFFGPRMQVKEPEPADAPLRFMQNGQGLLYTNRPLTQEELERLTRVVASGEEPEQLNIGQGAPCSTCGLGKRNLLAVRRCPDPCHGEVS